MSGSCFSFVTCLSVFCVWDVNTFEFLGGNAVWSFHFGVWEWQSQQFNPLSRFNVAFKRSFNKPLNFQSTKKREEKHLNFSSVEWFKHDTKPEGDFISFYFWIILHVCVTFVTIFGQEHEEPSVLWTFHLEEWPRRPRGLWINVVLLYNH